MNLVDYARVLRRRWRFILLFTVLGAVCGVAASSFVSPRYEARAQMFVGSPLAGDASQGTILQNSEFTMQRIRSYSQLVDSPLVLNPVIAKLNLNDTRGQLAARTSSSSPPDTVLLNVSVEDSNAQRSADIANAVALQLAEVIAKLEKSAPVQVSQVQPATTPEFPTQPRPRLNLALGLVAGLSLGLLAAVVRETFDTSVGTAEEIEEVTGSPTLARVPYLARMAVQPVVTLSTTQPFGEPYRRARTNIEFASVDDPVRTLSITSSIQSEGKSTTSVNIAVAFAQAGSKVVLVEADLRRPMLTSMLGMGSGKGLTDLIAGHASIADVVQEWELGGISFIAHGTTPPNPSELLASRAMSTVLSELSSRFDLVILDCPPLLPVVDAAVLSGRVDGAVLVTRLGSVTRQQLGHSVVSLKAGNARLLGTIHTFVPQREQMDDYGSPVNSGRRGGRRLFHRRVPRLSLPGRSDDFGLEQSDKSARGRVHRA